MRISGTIQDSIVDGPGLRFTVFVQGCTRKCEGCHNPDTWDIHGGTEVSVEEVISQMRSNPLTDGLTISGGEPFLQAAECATLAAAARESGLNVWVYSGYTFEELTELSKTDHNIDALLKVTDVLVDGAFIQSERTLSLKWRGSKNQRIIDVILGEE
jgi:anaerobic ribonucleoside-triphosphate reductase activating protein